VNKPNNKLEVWLDDAEGPACQVGTLAHDRGQIRFHYTPAWLGDPRAFDVNPNIEKAEHVLNIDDGDNRPDLETVLSTAAFYGLSGARAKDIVQEVITAVASWKDIARQMRLGRADIELMAAAFITKLRPL